MAWARALLLGTKEGGGGACALCSSVCPESFYGQLCSTQRKEVYTWEHDPRCFQESSGRGCWKHLWDSPLGPCPR